MIPTIRDRDEGVGRLLQSMKDVGAYKDWDTLYRRRSDAASEYNTLYDGYLGILRVSLSQALLRWEGSVNAELESGGGTFEEALMRTHDRVWAGPGGDMNVIWSVRLVWLECIALNRKLGTGVRVRPETLLLEWLIDDGEDDLVHLLACMPYWPIGLDEDGNWC